MTRLPTLFLSHGSPMHAIDPGGAGTAWAALASGLPRPRAVLAVSAHWETGTPLLGSSRRFGTIHDFGGFPAALYRLRYDAPGAPDVADRARELLRAAGIVAGLDGCRGLDHGAWVPLRWMYPAADVPVVPLSVQPALGTGHHLAMGEALAPLADEGVLVVGSGHVTHNLRDWVTCRDSGRAPGYVAEFSAWLHDALRDGDRAAVVGYRDRAPAAARAHPTEEHFLPLLVAWGAAGPTARGERVHAGVEAAALAMDAYRF